MAIKVLTKLLAENAPKAMKERKFESYFGRKIAIDASTSIYQFLIVVGRSGTEMLTNEAGEVTSHLQGMFTRTIRLLEAGIKPVYVFYGKPPDLKKQELAKRYSKKADPSDGLAEAEETGNKVTKHHNEDCKRLLKLIEVPVIEAPSDGEAQCAALCKPGKVYAVASENMDSLTFGARFLLHLMDPSSRKVPVVEFEVAKTLEELNLTMDQFIDLCIFSECDYCDSIRGIVGQTALKLIRLHGSIENMLENISKERYHIPDDWPYQEARQLFKESVVYTNEVQHEIKRGAPDEEVINLLKLSHKSDHQTSSTHTATHLNNLLNTTLHTKNLKHATQIHAQIITNNYTCLPFLFNNLLNYYAKCGNINRSLLLFSTNHDRCKNIVGWTSLITHLSHCNKPLKALTFFNKMRCTGVYPNQFTFSAILPACADTMIVTHGEQVHCLIWKHGFKTDVFVGSALVGMYAKYADMSSAESVFYELPERSLVSWNSILVGFLQNKSYYRAVEVFREVLRQSLDSPDEVSCSAVLSGCANIGCVEFGRQAHGIAVKLGLVTLTYVKNSLMDMYCKCGLFGDAVKLFKTMGDTDVVAWNIMIMGCVHSNNFEEACNYFWVMRREGISPDEASYSSVLHASASLAALNQGTLIHDHTIKTGFVKNACVASSLITMYAKSGSLVDAYRVFEEIEDRNVVCWTAIIAACQQHGCANQVVELFEEMLGKGIKPDYITFVSVLSACSHAGHVEEGFVYFYSMTEVHAMNPGPEHYACMVDLLGRVGRLDEAKRFIESMPIKPDPSVWGALFGACRNYGNLEMGREIAERLFELEPDNPGNYVMLSNMFTCNGMLEEADEVRRLMRVNGVRKEPGCSWIDVKNTTFVFTVHDRSHSRTDEIYEILRKLEKLVKKKGYEPETQFAINSVEGYKEQSLWYHSEKLALAFGLLTLPVGTPIRIKKNLRTCGDCHTVMKFASEIFEREIIVRDINRFHRFTNGLCSCRDYW